MRKNLSEAPLNTVLKVKYVSALYDYAEKGKSALDNDYNMKRRAFIKAKQDLKETKRIHARSQEEFKSVTDNIVSEIKKLYEFGYSVESISKEIGAPVPIVYGMLRVKKMSKSQERRIAIQTPVEEAPLADDISDLI